MFDPYPRHGHRTPQQIAEDTEGTFEPTRPSRRGDEHDGSNGSMRRVANSPGTAAEPSRHRDASDRR